MLFLFIFAILLTDDNICCQEKIYLRRDVVIMVRKNTDVSIIEKVRHQNNVLNSQNCPELAKRIKILSQDFLTKNAELYKRLETR